MKQTMYRSYIDTPLGKLVIISSNKGICVVEFTEKNNPPEVLKRITNRYSKHEIKDTTNQNLKIAHKWIYNYFNGMFKKLPCLPLDLMGTTFEKKVWEILPKIQLGSLTTYGNLAHTIGYPLAARAVGGAVGRNPISIIVPCHRVIGALGTLTGFGGGLYRKKWLLEHEGFNVAGMQSVSIVTKPAI